tara:strand:+ start:378 stop:554 length:177 start_codon:yes stop_codon:yes gene_type:complete
MSGSNAIRIQEPEQKADQLIGTQPPKPKESGLKSASCNRRLNPPEMVNTPNAIYDPIR